MNLLDKLSQTYDAVLSHSRTSGEDVLLPLNHTTNTVNIIITLDNNGIFRRARVLEKAVAKKIIPCTERSGNRTGSKPIPHPLCDKLQYIAGDFVKYGGTVTSGYKNNPSEPHDLYMTLLREWCESEYKHPKVISVLKYCEKKTVVTDLTQVGIIYLNAEGNFLSSWNGNQKKPLTFECLSVSQLQDDLFIGWEVEMPHDPISDLSEDKNVWDCWSNFCMSRIQNRGLCYVSGKILPLAESHPSKIRNDGDKAKIISSNDKNGFTYRGRFTEAGQACGVSLEISYKAHNTLKWLIRRQGYKGNDIAVVAWCVPGKNVPQPFFDCSFDVKFDHIDVAQEYSLNLKNMIKGYRDELGDDHNILVVALESPTDGRINISVFKEIRSSSFLTNVEKWHSETCWVHLKGDKQVGASEKKKIKQKFIKSIYAPSPKQIAQAAYGPVDNSCLDRTIKELLPCIIDGIDIPIHLVQKCVSRASNPNISYWESTLSVACAVYKKFKAKQRKYLMTLERDLNTRDYLYGRLLALAEHIEEKALFLAKENRPTNASRLMQQFADHPYKTWLQLEKAIKPYENRLQSARAGYLYHLKQEIDSIMDTFTHGDFVSDFKLSGEFLLGYHCQRSAIRVKNDPSNDEIKMDIIE